MTPDIKEIVDGLAPLIEQRMAVLAKDVLTIDEAADYLGLAKSTLYKYYTSGKIAYHTPTGKRPIYFRKADLDEFMTRGRHESRHNLETTALKRRA